MNRQQQMKELKNEITTLEYKINNFYAVCFINEPDHAKRHAELKSLKKQLDEKNIMFTKLILN